MHLFTVMHDLGLVDTVKVRVGRSSVRYIKCSTRGVPYKFATGGLLLGERAEFHDFIENGRLEFDLRTMEEILTQFESGDPRYSPGGAANHIGLVYNTLSLARHRLSDLDGALEAADGGRARLLARSLIVEGIGAENTEIAARPDILAARLRRDELRTLLGQHKPSSLSSEVPGARSPFTMRAEHARILQGSIRQAHKEYLDILQRHVIAEREPLLDAAYARRIAPVGGAIVVPVLASHSAFAIIATQERIFTVNLPDVSERLVVRRVVDWLEAYGKAHWFKGLDYESAPIDTKRAAAPDCWNALLADTLKWLWDVLFEPIDLLLSSTTGANLSRGAPVIVLPPSMLGMMPLSAAGPASTGERFCDHWAVSFVPSLRSLAAIRRRHAARAGVSRTMLLISDSDLPAARSEVRTLMGRLSGVPATVLEGREATLQRVLDDLEGKTDLHVIRHGLSNPIDYNLSMIDLFDFPLQIDVLQTLNFRARLIYLSGCETARPNISTAPEEFAGFPTSFIGAGAECVIGSLWPVADDTACLLASKFYKLHLDESGREVMSPAQALREAQFWLRNVTLAEVKREFSSQAEVVSASPRSIRNVATEAATHGWLREGNSDDERPFAPLSEWSGWIVTGA
jgi:CHAT domain